MYVIGLGNGYSIPGTEVPGVATAREEAPVMPMFLAARAGTIRDFSAPLAPAPVVTTLSPRASLTAPRLAAEADLMPQGEARRRTGARRPDQPGTPADSAVEDAVQSVIGAEAGNTEAWVGPPTGGPNAVIVPDHSGSVGAWLCQDPMSRQCQAARSVATWLDRHWKKAAIITLVAVVGLILLRRR